jgi:putative transposase
VIQSIQQGFENALRIEGNKAHSLEDLNHKFSVWLQTVYHNRVHSSTNLSPLARYQQGMGAVRRLSADVKIDELFYMRLERRVRKDGTVRIEKQLYEVALSLRALKVQLRLDPFSLQRIEVWHQDRFVGLAKAANLNVNGETGGRQNYV